MSSMQNQILGEALKDIPLLYNVSLKEYTYTKTGGPADVLALPKTKEEVIAIIKYSTKHNIPCSVIGHGSNIIIRDGGIRGIVLLLTNMNKIDVRDNQICVQAGAKLIDVSYEALYHNLTGLEFACGIPGSVGGAIYMNAGAFDEEIKDVLHSADVLLRDGTVKTLSNEMLKFSFRHSIISDMKCVILQSTFSLKKGNLTMIKNKMDELTRLREFKQPLELPSCGSVFKRPQGYFAGKLIQDAGLQGMKHGGAQISKKHAGFIINVDRATATDYIELIKYIQDVVKEKFNVLLEPEVRILGEEN